MCLESLMTNPFFLNMQFFFLSQKALGSVLAFFIFPIPSLSLILFCCFRGELFGYIATVSFEIGRPKYDTQISLSSLISPHLAVVHLVTEVADFKYEAELTLAMMSFN